MSRMPPPSFFLPRVLPLIVAAAMILLPGCGQPGPMLRDEFKKKVMGLDEDGVRAALGGPERIDPGIGWVYLGVTKEAAGSKPDHAAVITFIGGRVVHVSYRKDDPRRQDVPAG
jgi:hypothetical protein